MTSDSPDQLTFPCVVKSGATIGSQLDLSSQRSLLCIPSQIDSCRWSMRRRPSFALLVAFSFSSTFDCNSHLIIPRTPVHFDQFILWSFRLLSELYSFKHFGPTSATIWADWLFATDWSLVSTPAPSPEAHANHWDPTAAPWYIEYECKTMIFRTPCDMLVL